jgi:hypothetical protein
MDTLVIGQEIFFLLVSVFLTLQLGPKISIRFRVGYFKIMMTLDFEVSSKQRNTLSEVDKNNKTSFL